MCRLIESIRVAGQQLKNIDYHNERLNRSRNHLFNKKNNIDIRDYVEIKNNSPHEERKCRVIYKEDIEQVEFENYSIKKIPGLKLVYDDQIEYDFKYENRYTFQQYLEKHKPFEILIVKEGYITDSSFSNIAFYDGHHWYTPSTYLLKGTMRSFLAELGQLRIADIKPADLKHFKKACLINAMLDLQNSPLVDIKDIIP